MSDAAAKTERKEGEEFYQPRGPGSGWYPCFVCGHGGGTEDAQSGAHVQTDMAGYVSDKEAGERVVEMFWAMKGHASLDYREHEPTYVQVKIGACSLHEPNLHLLCEMTHAKGNTISLDILKRVFPGQPRHTVEEVVARFLREHESFKEAIAPGRFLHGKAPMPTDEQWTEHLVAALDSAGYSVVERT